MFSLTALSLRNLSHHRLRTTLSALAVALGVAMTVAADVIGQAITHAGQELETSQNTAGMLGAQLESLLTLTGLVILAVAGFLVFNAFAMSITQRRRQIGALRSLGMTRKQVMRLLLVEALITGGLGTLVGLIAGPLLGRGIVVLLGELAHIAYGKSLPSPDNMLLATALGMGITLASILFPARRAMRISPLTALRSETHPPDKPFPRWIAWVGLLTAVTIILTLSHFPPAQKPQQPWNDVWNAILPLAWAGSLILCLPSLIAGLGRWMRAPLTRLWGAAGRLIADNLQRDRSRVMLTILTLALSIAMIVSITGFMTVRSELMLAFYTGKQIPPTWGYYPIGTFDEIASWQLISELDLADFGFSDEIYREMTQKFADRAEIMRMRITIIPRLDVVPGAFSFILDPQKMQQIGVFDFYEGDWETAISIMESGCGILVTPGLARKNNVWLYDTLTVPARDGPLECTVAGLGLSANFGATLIGDAVIDAFDMPDKPFGLFIQAYPNTDVDRLAADLDAFAGEHPGTYMMPMQEADNFMSTMIDGMLAMLNGPLLLAIATAALGVINTTAMSVTERRRELGLLRAVGATRRQAGLIVIGEAAWMGLIGGALGLLIGGGVIYIHVMAGDHSAWGIRNPDLWSLVWRAGKTAVLNGLVGALTAPFICALAAWLPAKSILRGSAIETMNEGRIADSVSRRRPGRNMQHAMIALAWRNLTQDRLRAALSALAVALGVTMIVAANVAGNGFRSGFESDESQRAFAFMFDSFEVSLNVVGVVILAAAGFVIFNAFAMSVTKRRRQIGALRSLGMTRRQVMRLVLVEALLTGGLGALLGLVVGPLLGDGVLALVRSAGFETGAGRVSLANVVLAVALALGLSLLSVSMPARRATRISPLVALRERNIPSLGTTRRLPLLWVGMLIIAALAAYLVLAPPGEWALPPWNMRMPFLLSLPWLAALLMLLPALVGALGGLARAPLTRLLGATGRLIADNLGRDRRRVTLTILTLVVGLTMIVSLTGVFTFTLDVLFRHAAGGILERPRWNIYPNLSSTDPTLETFAVKPEVIEDVYAIAKGRADVGGYYYVFVPEIGALVPNFPSLMADLDIVLGSGGFTFTAGRLDTARTIMESGCGLLLPPGVAARNEVGVGDTLTLQGRDGPVACLVAGIGSGGFFYPTSFISLAARDKFEVGATPSILHVAARPGTDAESLQADLMALQERHGPDADVRPLDDELNGLIEGNKMLLVMLNSLLLLAVAAAALGVVNTTMMSVAERRQELGLLRAVGATKRQVGRVVAGEAALIGLVGGLFGLVAGAGLSVIFVVSFGGNSWGVPDLDLWAAAWRSLQPALLNGLVGLVVAPLLCAGAAWLPVRAILRGSAIETMNETATAHSASRRRPARHAKHGIRTRFVVATMLVMSLTVLGLVAVVTAHERNYIRDRAYDMLQAMAEGQATMVELLAPDDAQTLDLETLQIDAQFDANALLRFRSLIDEMTDNGMEEFVIADRDNVILISLDARDIGTLAPKMAAPHETTITSQHEQDAWKMTAQTPIQNGEETTIGSVRITINLASALRFLKRVRTALWTIGSALVAIGGLASWWLTTPLVRMTRQLTARAAGVARGEYVLFQRPGAGWRQSLSDRLSLRFKLTATWIAILICMIAALQLATLPAERHYLEEWIQDTMLGTVEWMGQALSQSIDMAPFKPETGAPANPAPEQMIELARGMDWAKLQELGERARSRDMAYLAIVDDAGVVMFSDQLALIGETMPVSSQTGLQETRWRGEAIWAVSTPIRRGQHGERIATLHMGLRRKGIEAFLRTSKNLIWLAGIIAALTGVLLAQGVSKAITAPVRQLAAGARQVAAGNLAVTFGSATQQNNELGQLAQSFDQMMVGLREREWLRDMFGRFVSREVAEAIRSGQVRLEGENRVVSILFCDIQDFSARSAQSTPQEIVALLNAYLPLVVNAAREHNGTVNKFGGDSTLIIYGAPRQLRESAYQAVLTALRIQHDLQELNATLRARGKAPLKIGVGINTGAVLAGAVGPAERQEYTVIGDTVNLASRIEALNRQHPAHNILISEQTYQALGTRRREFEWVSLGPIQIRGKIAPIGVWAVTGLKSRGR